MTDKHDAFEQVECENPLVREEVKEMETESDVWVIEYPDERRKTSFVGFAYFARHFDDEAEVRPA